MSAPARPAKRSNGDRMPSEQRTMQDEQGALPRRLRGAAVSSSRQPDSRKPWDGIVSAEEQRAYNAAGFGRPSGVGRRPALLIIAMRRVGIIDQRKVVHS